MQQILDKVNPILLNVTEAVRIMDVNQIFLLSVNKKTYFFHLSWDGLSVL